MVNINRKIQIKTSVRYHYTSINLTKILAIPSADEDIKPGLSQSLVEMQNAKATLENHLAVSYKDKHARIHL